MSTKVRDGLHRVNWSPNWVFRRYSSEKGKEFVKSTGIPAKDSTRAQAYRAGLALYDKWLGTSFRPGRKVLIRDIGRALKESKQQRSPNTYRAFASQIDNHVNPAFGHFRPDQVTSLLWEQYDADSRRRVYRKTNGREYRRTKLFNTRKALNEILHCAHEERLIDRVPVLKNFDLPAAPPQHISTADVRRIRRACPWPVKLLVFLMFYQGARPGEVMQYEWSMISWIGTPKIIIPASIAKTRRGRTIPLNSRVARALRWLKGRTASRWLFAGRREDKPLSAYNAVWDRAMSRLEMDYTIYNLRDTFITNALKRGLNSTFIGKFCDTSAEMIDRKYAVAEDEVMQSVAG